MTSRPAIARVEPLTRTRAFRGPFDYRLREDQDQVGIGSVLRVPFGRQRPLGVVVGMADRSELAPERLAEPDSVLPAALPEDLVSLAAWMAGEYCSTPARALGLLLPPGAADGIRAKEVLVARLTELGRAAGGAGERLTDRQQRALARLGRDGPTAAVELGTATLRRLEARGLVTISPQVHRRRPRRHRVGVSTAAAPSLTAEQELALAGILPALRESRPLSAERRFLLQGVTGSGKTEVYLQAVEEVLAAGRTAIVLVPEIALTPQALGRFEARFGDVVAVLHSSLGRGERYDEWLRLARGEARVCVGPRSAVFAPLKDIGLIVVDEEHEGSYKHEGDPRYDARAVAERRAQQHGAVLVLGSATPRPESTISHTRLRLRARIDGRGLPPVEVLDMRGQHHPLHPRTRMALADLRRGGGKAIVLLNRRGWSNFLSCRACGQVWICPNCEVALVLHAGGPGGAFVACHHCGHRERAPQRCAACNSVAVARHGAGTERIEHELREVLGEPDFPVFRLDADSNGLNERAHTLERFQAAPAGLLVGTQMVAKGHDFPDVALGVVLDADQTLRFPDFRSEERTFALVTQLAGRAGRGAPREGLSGRVLVQTLAPEARAIRFAAHHDADGFLAGELEHRRALSYPPFASLIRIVCSAEEAGDGAAVAAALKARIEPPGATVLGPAALFALRGRARRQLLIKAPDRSAAIAAVGDAVGAVARGASRRGVSVSVDVDPQ
jgi:primosomal protein N' (replication factor Y) (superfamily II helicase)